MLASSDRRFSAPLFTALSARITFQENAMAEKPFIALSIGWVQQWASPSLDAQLRELKGQ